MQTGWVVFLLVCWALQATLAAHAAAQDSNYLIFPVHERRGAIRRRGLLESGKVDVDGRLASPLVRFTAPSSGKYIQELIK
jgi:hypothetical protein